MHGEYAYGMWIIALFYAGLFLVFIIGFVRPKGREEWRSMSVVSAFFVALFTEMFGFPLTIFILTSWFGDAYPALVPFNHKFGHLLVVVFGGSDLAWFIVMSLSFLFLLMGYLLLSKGWRQIHAAHGKLVKDGIYAYARHPQYTGLFLVIIAFLIQWPTFITVLMAPVLVLAYRHLAKNEERQAREQYGMEYLEYAEKTVAFFPKFKQWKAFVMAEPYDWNNKPSQNE